jgi:hypothetical protein
MLGDPAFLVESVGSYYDVVDKLVALYDREGIGWNGLKLPISECIEQLMSVDTRGKVVLLAGDFHSAALSPLEADTAERNAALEALGGEWDWILQLDTDEVLGSVDRLVASLRAADISGKTAVEYPARWLYCQIRGSWYLERCRRLFGISATYPGAVAVKPGLRMRLARQSDADLWRVDFRRRNTDVAHPRGVPVHQTVRRNEGIWHFSWVRELSAMQEKARVSGHASDFNWDDALERWALSSRRPFRTTILTPFRRRPNAVGGPTWLRPTLVRRSVLTR